MLVYHERRAVAADELVNVIEIVEGGVVAEEDVGLFYFVHRRVVEMQPLTPAAQKPDELEKRAVYDGIGSAVVFLEIDLIQKEEQR